MEGELLRVDTALTTLPASPTNSFISTCPLLTPSPPTNDLINPLPESSEPPTFTIGDELATKLQHVKDDEKEGGDSASSSSSALAEPACTQLLNHRHYHHITKDEDTSAQETNGKTQPLQLTFRNPPDNYFFMTWNWPIIRKVSLWMFLSALVAMVSLVVAMVWSLPKTCNPNTYWYQGNVIYEVFPGSFADSNGDGIGDFNGLKSKVNYIQSLGVRGVRLNSIFASQEYPENYKNITSLTKIAAPLGTMKDFVNLTNILHDRNISVVLDLPLWPFVKRLSSNSKSVLEINETDHKPSAEFLRSDPDDKDEVSEAINFWVHNNVDGFYLKGLENLVDDVNFGASVRRWKKILGPDRALIISQSVLEVVPKNLMNTIMNNVDLIDIRLEVENGLEHLTKQLENIQNGTLFDKPGRPWVHWSLGNETSVRLANRLACGNATLGATLLQLMLPGTPSIFYGDEIGMKQVDDIHEDRKDLLHLHQLGAMVWEDPSQTFTRKSFLPWMHGQPTQSNFEQLDPISKMVSLRADSPSIYMNSVSKDGATKANAEIKYSQNEMLVIQRWYPRRKSYVVVSNLGTKYISADLSTLLYSGQVVVRPRAGSGPESISFKDVSLWPGESVIVLLD